MKKDEKTIVGEENEAEYIVPMWKRVCAWIGIAMVVAATASCALWRF